MVNDNGIAACVDACTGKEIWRNGSGRLTPLRRSMLGETFSDFFGQSGKTTVIEAAPNFTLLAENKLDDGFLASPAVSGDALYLRTKTSLYCIRASATLRSLGDIG